jgi:hypothetical protein
LHAGQAGGQQVDRLSRPVAGGGGQAVQDFHVAVVRIPPASRRDVPTGSGTRAGSAPMPGDSE